MTKDLADSHLDIAFNGMASFMVAGYQIQGTDFHPASIRHQLRGDRMPIPNKTFDEIIPKYYLTKAKVGTDLGNFRVNMGIIPRNNKDLLYLRFTSFQLLSQYLTNNTTSTPVKPVLTNSFAIQRILQSMD